MHNERAMNWINCKRPIVPVSISIELFHRCQLHSTAESIDIIISQSTNCVLDSVFCFCSKRDHLATHELRCCARCAYVWTAWCKSNYFLIFINNLCTFIVFGMRLGPMRNQLISDSAGGWRKWKESKDNLRSLLFEIQFFTMPPAANISFSLKNTQEPSRVCWE